MCFRIEVVKLQNFANCQPQVQSAHFHGKNERNGNKIATEDQDENQLQFQVRSPTWPLHNPGHLGQCSANCSNHPVLYGRSNCYVCT